MIVVNANALLGYASLEKLNIWTGFQEQQEKHSINTSFGVRIGVYSSTEDCSE